MENSFYVLLAVLIPLSIAVFILTEFDILNPVCIVTSLMTFSVFLATTKIERWHLYMSADASLLIISSLICFVIGGLWADWQIKRNINGIPITKENCVYMISNSRLLLMSLIILILGYFQYREFYDASIMLGNKSGPLDFSSMIRSIGPAIENERFKFSRWYNYRIVIAQMLFYCSVFVFFTRSILHSGKFDLTRSNFIYLLPMISFLPFIICNRGRMLPLHCMLFILLTGTIISQIKAAFSLNNKIKVIGALIACGVVFLLIFLVLGMLSGKVRMGGRSPYEILVHYVGLSMPAFSVFLERIQIESPYIGNNSLMGIYSNLNRLGANLPPVKGYMPFFHFNDISTNVYTMMAKYIMDYGFIGMHIIMSFIGMFYVSFYDYVRLISKKLEHIAYYALLSMTLFFATNDDHFIGQVINTNTLYQFATLYIIFKLFVIKKKIHTEQ